MKTWSVFIQIIVTKMYFNLILIIYQFPSKRKLECWFEVRKEVLMKEKE